MPETQLKDRYDTIATCGPLRYELRGPGIDDVPLQFEPDLSFVLTALLRQKCIVVADVSRSPEFRQLTGIEPGFDYDNIMLTRTRAVIESLERRFFTLGSTLIQRDKGVVQVGSRLYEDNTCRTDPRYTIVNEQNH